MKKYIISLIIMISASFMANASSLYSAIYKKTTMPFIDSLTIQRTVDTVQKYFPTTDHIELYKGVEQTASFWIETDGSKEDFLLFCKNNYLSDPAEKKLVLEKFSKNMEIINGYYNTISVELKEPLHMKLGNITPIDQLFGGFEPSSHLTDVFFQDKIAFYILLNFVCYSLAEKTEQGLQWSREKWAMVRMAETIKARIPGEISLKAGEVLSLADSYISDYNIYMGNILSKTQQRLFPPDMKLIAHWGLRDELKANYNKPGGIEKQKAIYAIMQHIISQDIPAQVINSDKYTWDPENNKLYEGTRQVSGTPEPDTRYGWLLKNFKALSAMDRYNPSFPTYIQSKFESEMEIPQKDVEKLFRELVSSPEVKQVATLISKRLKRKLEPFDIWYDGFKARSSMNISELDSIIRKKYPNSQAFEKDIPNFLLKLGFTPEKAAFIASKIQVDAARGSGHAWGAQRKGDKARLRTRIGDNGMDYKGFNIAIHEFGHCVEQTLTLYDMDQYLLSGIPNTAFTEALAFTFQQRDLQLLGINDDQKNNNELQTLDIFWSNYEIMGVSLVDMQVWKWLYQHPDADKETLKKEVIQIAKEIWNTYYAPVFGIKDQSILAIYSHMIDNPLYLSAYPIGHLIHFQIEKQIEGKNFADEIMRIYSKGRITPQIWLKESLGEELTNKPLLDATDKALQKITNK